LYGTASSEKNCVEARKERKTEKINGKKTKRKEATNRQRKRND
jgi:hypothetical protein